MTSQTFDRLGGSGTIVRTSARWNATNPGDRGIPFQMRSVNPDGSITMEYRTPATNVLQRTVQIPPYELQRFNCVDESVDEIGNKIFINEDGEELIPYPVPADGDCFYSSLEVIDSDDTRWYIPPRRTKTNWRSKAEEAVINSRTLSPIEKNEALARIRKQDIPGYYFDEHRGWAEQDEIQELCEYWGLRICVYDTIAKISRQFTSMYNSIQPTFYMVNEGNAHFVPLVSYEYYTKLRSARKTNLDTLFAFADDESMEDPKVRELLELLESEFTLALIEYINSFDFYQGTSTASLSSLYEFANGGVKPDVVIRYQNTMDTMDTIEAKNGWCWHDVQHALGQALFQWYVLNRKNGERSNQIISLFYMANIQATGEKSFRNINQLVDVISDLKLPVSVFMYKFTREEKACEPTNEFEDVQREPPYDAVAEEDIITKENPYRTIGSAVSIDEKKFEEMFARVHGLMRQESCDNVITDCFLSAPGGDFVFELKAYSDIHTIQHGFGQLLCQFKNFIDRNPGGLVVPSLVLWDENEVLNDQNARIIFAVLCSFLRPIRLYVWRSVGKSSMVPKYASVPRGGKAYHGDEFNIGHVFKTTNNGFDVWIEHTGPRRFTVVKSPYESSSHKTLNAAYTLVIKKMIEDGKLPNRKEHKMNVQNEFKNDFLSRNVRDTKKHSISNHPEIIETIYYLEGDDPDPPIREIIFIGPPSVVNT